MTDHAMKSNEKFPVENSETMPKEVPPAEEEDNLSPEDELKARLIMQLPADDLKSLQVQKQFLEEAMREVSETHAIWFKAQVVANMLQVAYNVAWKTVQQKHELPEDLDIDWADGSVFHKVTEPVSAEN